MGALCSWVSDKFARHFAIPSKRAVSLDKVLPSLSAAQYGHAEAEVCVKRLTLEKSGEGTDGESISFVCFDDYFITKIQDVA